MSTSVDNPRTMQDRRWIWGIALSVMALTLLPYLVGAGMAQGRHFMWLGYNLDDSCVYLSWMRQAAEGSNRAYNLFTTEPQSGMVLNPLFLVLGRMAGWVGISLLAIYQTSRLLFGICFLLAVWWFAKLTITDTLARKWGVLLVCVSSGFGWLPMWWDIGTLSAPVDTWQPEAITFLSLLLSPLFLFSLTLQVVTLGQLFIAARTSQVRPAVIAGICGFLLGLVHSYDVISVSAVWSVYILALTGRTKGRGIGRIWLLTLLAGLIASPGVAYIYYQYRSEAVFRARANVATLSAPIFWVILGYGLTLLLAAYGTYLCLRHRAEAQEHEADRREEVSASDENRDYPEGALLLMVWMVMNILVAYTPGLAFQRKMLQGAHIPIALLAGIGAASLRSRLPASLQKSSLTLPVLLLLLGMTNVRFMVREVVNYASNRAQTKQHRTYLEKGEAEALEWITSNTKPENAIQPLPWVILVEQEGRQQRGAYDSTLACFTPGLTNRKVYCGHWGETPEYGTKLLALSRFAYPETTETERMALLREMKVDYLIFSQKRQADEKDNRSAEKLAPMFRDLAELPEYLTRVYQNEDADIYRVNWNKVTEQ